MFRSVFFLSDEVISFFMIFKVCLYCIQHTRFDEHIIWRRFHRVRFSRSKQSRKKLSNSYFHIHNSKTRKSRSRGNHQNAKFMSAAVIFEQ